jgi:hypothetical protein
MTILWDVKPYNFGTLISTFRKNPVAAILVYIHFPEMLLTFYQTTRLRNPESSYFRSHAIETSYLNN